MEFIPAKESRFFIWFFYWFTRFILFLRFQKVHVIQKYKPIENTRTVYFINHNYWWDGLLPLYLNNKLFKQRARAMMEDKQMRQHKFFRKLGAFSVNLEQPELSFRSLKYALESLQQPHSSLFIYPEGKIVPFSTNRPEFKPGLAWLYQNSYQVDFVPIAFYIEHLKHSKPELHISIGESVQPDKKLSKKDLTYFFEIKTQELLGYLVYS